MLTLASRGVTDPIPRLEDGSSGWIAGGTVRKRSRLRQRGAKRSGIPVATSLTRNRATHSTGSPSQLTDDDEAGLLRLVELDDSLFDRLAFTVANRCITRSESGDLTSSEAVALEVALIARAETLVGQWLPRATADVRRAEVGQAASATRDGDAWRLVLPLRWLTEVWFPGYGITTGYLILDAATRHDGALTVTGIDTQARPTSLAISQLT